MSKRYGGERFYIDHTGTACVSGGAQYDPKEEAKRRKEYAKAWRESLTPEMAWVVDVIAKVDKYARGHNRTMALHAFHTQRVDKHANMPKSDVIAKICFDRKEEFEQFIHEHFKKP